ncbi:DinB family protein [Blastococcus xanthinilyticus]|uniref:Putative damage-inducible protein DinB n=1 Tax=Blastococcus xanthinilyticus TaxID=1564164 RepID=A0A5S5CKZ8_9ACTN|nr:DinB family protein [Blastococcus xanthinilyticus]TYP81253.1 putative damage-inducible protein DinB [Blastococcus xanthinilyticus]
MTLPERVRPPVDGDERAQLVGWLDLQRSLVHYKCAELGDDDASRALLPTSPLMTVAGLVNHLRWVEHCWFDVMFLGRPSGPNPQFGDEEAADFRVDGIPLAELLAGYDRQCAESNRITAAAALEELGRFPGYESGRASLRWILGHMIEEVARHVGHLDLLRELLDGRKGYY